MPRSALTPWRATAIAALLGAASALACTPSPADVRAPQRAAPDPVDPPRHPSPLLDLRFRHARAARIAASSDGRWLVTHQAHGSRRTVRVFAYPSGDVVATVEADAFAVAARAPVLALERPRGEGLHVSSLGSATPRCTVPNEDAFTLALSDDGALLLTEGIEGLRVLSVERCRFEDQVDLDSALRVRDLAVIGADPVQVLLATNRGLARWRRGEPSLHLDPTPVGLHALAQLRGGDVVAAPSFVGNVQRYPSQSPATSITVPIPGTVQTLKTSPDRRWAVGTTDLGAVLVFDPYDGAVRWRHEHEAEEADATFDADGTHVLLASSDALIRRYDAATGAPRPLQTNPGTARPLRRPALSASKDTLYVPRDFGVARLPLDPAQGEARTFDPAPTRMVAMAYAPGPNTPWGLLADGHLVRWNSEGALARTRRTELERPRLLRVFDEHLLVAGRRTLGVFDPDTLARRARFERPRDRITALAADPARCRAFVGWEVDGVTVHALDDARLLTELPWTIGHTPTQLEFSPDGRTLAIAARSVRLLHAGTLAETARVSFWETRRAVALAWSPDGAHLAVADSQHGLWRLDGETGTVKDGFRWNAAAVTGLAWLDDARWLLALEDGTAVTQALHTLTPDPSAVARARVTQTRGGPQLPADNPCEARG